MSMAPGRGPASKPTAAGRGRILEVGGKSYGWLRDALRVYGTAVTLVQLLPVLLALAAVLFSPTAWLSATLRRWVLAGTIVGTLAGMVLLARRAGLADLRGPLTGKLRDRATELSHLAWWGLATALAAAVALRIHLATVDIGFIESYQFMVPLFDYYLGGGRLAGTVFNSLAALLSAVLVGGLVAGGPSALLRWREVRQAEASLADEGGPLAALNVTVSALDEAKSTLSLFKQEFVDLRLERDELASRLEVALEEIEELREQLRQPSAQAMADAEPNVQDVAVTSATTPPAHHGPRATSDRHRR